VILKTLHRHHFICPIIQQYAHFREYDSRRAGQQGPIRTLTAALKMFNKKQSPVGAYSITQIKILQTRKKLDKSIFLMLFLKTFKDAKFVVDGNAVPDIYYSINEKLLSNTFHTRK